MEENAQKRDEAEQEEAERDARNEASWANGTTFLNFDDVFGSNYNSKVEKPKDVADVADVADIEKRLGEQTKKSNEKAARLTLEHFEWVKPDDNLVEIDTPAEIKRNRKVLRNTNKYNCEVIRASNEPYSVQIFYTVGDSCDRVYHAIVNSFTVFTFQVQAQASQQHDPP
jgi:hypothetical protein